MVWNAVSTLELSNADVSMSDNPFSAAATQEHQHNHLADSARLHITLVANEDRDDVWVSELPQLPQPPFKVDEACIIGDIIHEHSTKSSPIVPSPAERPFK
ncbi:hypothetical protein H0H81_002673 [Sphagnurus paluster]|uniref:Uncharacterized protein n=1 Tax=Sphagnurus paluster TaxID=117069 RepID=A0A9P7FZE2_9AGAR|nr:hypothetical protein H0H81_002673 [Sphagnurus paluster]